jgi:hypothetical protein
MLAEKCLRLLGLDWIDSVLVAFPGIGITAVACALLVVIFVGCDIDEVYLGEAGDRTEAAVRDRSLPGRGTAKMRKVSATEPLTARKASGA